MKLYDVWVKADYRFNRAQVAGREFLRDQVTQIPESQMNEEILRSPILQVDVHVEPSVPPPTVVEKIEVAPQPVEPEPAKPANIAKEKTKKRGG